MSTSSTRPKNNEYAEFYAKYVSLVPEDESLTTVLESARTQLIDWLKQVGTEGEQYQYAPDKWTVAQSLQHIIDTERVFTYRVTTFARGDEGPLPGFDQDAFAKTSGATPGKLSDLLEEYELHAKSVAKMFERMSQEELMRQGTMSGHLHSVRAIGHIIAGHTLHHVNLFEERYSEAKK